MLVNLADRAMQSAESHTKCFYIRFADVNFSTNPSADPLLLLISADGFILNPRPQIPGQAPFKDLLQSSLRPVLVNLADRARLVQSALV